MTRAWYKEGCCYECRDPCPYGGPFHFVSSQPIDEQAYIALKYNTGDKSWAEMLERLRP